MVTLRRRLSWILSGWLALQLVGLVAPVALAAAGIELEEVCTCPGIEHGATCPMHHPASRKAEDSERCTMHSASAPLEGVLLPLSVLGEMPAIVTAVAVDMAAVLLPSSVSSILDRSAIPDAPPPRA